MDSSLSPSVSSTMVDCYKPVKLRVSSDSNLSAPCNGGGAGVVTKHPEQVKRRNARERKRVQNVNQGFVMLRNHVPQPNAKSKKLSKVETLRAATSYIQYLRQLLTSVDTHHHVTNNNNNNNGYNVNVVPGGHPHSHRYVGHQEQEQQLGYIGGFSTPSIISSSSVDATTSSNYYGGATPVYCPQTYSTGDYSRAYKMSPTTVAAVACGSGGSDQGGYDYVLSPPEIKQYHHHHGASDFNIMQSYS